MHTRRPTFGNTESLISHTSTMSSPTPHSYRLPDLHFLCPWKASFNPHHGEAATASSEWVLSYAQSAIGSGDRLEFFQQKGSKLLAAWAYPYAGPEQLRTCCDFINLTYVIDEASDRQDGKDARSTAVTVLNTMKDNAYDDGTILCSMTKEWVLYSLIAIWTDGSLHHLT